MRTKHIVAARYSRFLRQTSARFLLAMALIAAVLSGCGPRAPAIASANLKYSGLLRTATNTKKPARLVRAKDVIEKDHAAGVISADEYSWYADIIALAEAGRWREAEEKATQFRRDQRR